jgi:hypothetical protein
MSLQHILLLPGAVGALVVMARVQTTMVAVRVVRVVCLRAHLRWLYLLPTPLLLALAALAALKTDHPITGQTVTILF